MRVIFLIILSLMLNGYSWAYLTAGKIAVTATSSSSGVPSTSQDSDITDTKGSSVSVGVPVAVTGSVNITGNYQVNGTPISATSNWSQVGSTINYTAGNVGIGTSSPGTTLDVSGTVRSTAFNVNGYNGILGTWNNPNCSATPVQATKELLVFANAQVNSSAGEIINCITDSNSSPTTVRTWQVGTTSLPYIGCSMVVKKGDYWIVDNTGAGSVSACNSYNIAIGS